MNSALPLPTFRRGQCQDVPQPGADWKNNLQIRGAGRKSRNHMENPSQNPTVINHDVRFHHSHCWKAVFAGVVTCIGIHLLLMCLGVAIGLATFSPTTDANPRESFTIGSAVAWSICALISLYVGGWFLPDNTVRGTAEKGETF